MYIILYILLYFCIFEYYFCKAKINEQLGCDANVNASLHLSFSHSKISRWVIAERNARLPHLFKYILLRFYFIVDTSILYCII